MQDCFKKGVHRHTKSKEKGYSKKKCCIFASKLIAI